LIEINVSSARLQYSSFTANGARAIVCAA